MRAPLCLLPLAFAIAAPAQEPSLLFDVNRLPQVNPSSSPGDFTPLGDSVYFVAGGVYPELWRTRAEPKTAHRLRTFYYMPHGYGIEQLTPFRDRLWFMALDPDLGYELFTSDGTPEGTRVFVDLAAGRASSYPWALTVMGENLYFHANGRELWRTDGTLAGTQRIRTFSLLPEVPERFVAAGSRFYFVANDGISGSELWRSDGTDAGTQLVADVFPGAAGSSPGQLTLLGDRLFFAASDGTHGVEPWLTDGTPSGTRLLADVRPGSADAYPMPLDALGSLLFFVANDGTHGHEPWVTDGTTAGTRLLADLMVGATGSMPERIAVAHGAVFFAADDGWHGHELWRSDGSTTGTSLVMDFMPGGEGSHPYGWNLNGRLLLGAFTKDWGRELWQSDGTAAGTKIVADISPGPASSGPKGLVLGDRLWLSARTEVHGDELWLSDGTTKGTIFLEDLRPAPPGSESSYPGPFVAAAGAVFFSANDGTIGNELWKSDGTTPGTSHVQDLQPGPTGSTRALATLGGWLLFSGESGPTRGLYRTDGTVRGATLLAALSAVGLEPMVLFGNELYFQADDMIHGRELWKTDGTAAGTMMVRDVRPGYTSAMPETLVVASGLLFFQADDGVTGRELWTSDGTHDGTVLVADLNPGKNDSRARPELALGSLLLFGADDGSNGYELFASDGTAAGTRRLLDLWPGSGSSEPSSFARLGSLALFGAKDPLRGRELWRTDGTAAGTTLVKDIHPSISTSGNHVLRLTALGGGVLFNADDGVHGLELWRSDGTAAGTNLVADLSPEPAQSWMDPPVVAGTRRVAFGLGGHRLVLSDGTTAGTRELDVAFEQYLAVGVGRFFFGASDDQHGVEPWTLFPGATAQPIGEPCGGKRRPSLRAPDPVLGTTIRVAGRHAYPGAIGVVMAGRPARLGEATGNGCWSYAELASLIPLHVLRVGASDWRFALVIPNDAALAGARAMLQTWFLGTDAPLGYEATNGVALTLGW